MKYRTLIEIRWLQTLANESTLKEIKKFDNKTNFFLNKILEEFSEKDADKIKQIESEINHDVKAVEYFLKEKITTNPELNNIKEFIHFGCTSEDINNVAYAMMIEDSKKNILLPTLHQLIKMLKEFANQYAAQPMLARTHGQPASPTTVGKEFSVFVTRLKKQIKKLETITIEAKFNGAVGNYHAHTVAYPKIDWQKLTKTFIESLSLDFNEYSSQIDSHDSIAELSNCIARINTILIDFCRDIWFYIALGYLIQKPNKKEVGSSTMPHKINPIDFENAEGNLGLANAMLNHFAEKLPISRLQRDLSDSTVMRNIGSAFAYCDIAYQSIEKGLSKLEIDSKKMIQELNEHWEVLAEPIQTVMRKYHISEPYEKLKALTRSKKITQKLLHDFIDSLDIPKDEKERLKKLTPENYLGLAIKLAENI